jgi:hypothetical protein
VYLTQGAGVTAPSTVGTYGIRITPATIGASGALQGSAAVNLTITVSAAASLDTKVVAATSKVFVQGPTSGAQTAVPAADSTVAVSSAVPAATPAATAYMYILPSNAAGTDAARESLTVTTNIGLLGTADNVALGRSLNVIGNGASATRVYIFPDGNSGVANISVTTASGVAIATKSVRFFGAMASLTGTALTAIVGTTGTVRVAANDAAAVLMSSLRSGEEIYAFSSDATIATVPATALSYSVDSAVVTVTGVKAGTATITFGNKSTLATSTITSAPVTVRVGSTAISSVKVAFDKATYAPGEKATITLAAYDATNLLVVPGTYELFAAGKVIAPDKNFSQGTFAATTDTSVTFATATVAGTSTAGFVTYTVFMPTTPGVVTITGTLANPAGSATNAGVGTLRTVAAIQGTAVTASATVSDSGSAALAAVTALATTVASLRTLIVTLTNLVLKIQKKVRA